MRVLVAPAMLVALGSCQFTGQGAEVDVLPNAADDESALVLSAERPKAQVGPANDSVEEALALRLAAQAAKTAEAEQAAMQAGQERAQAVEAQASAEQDRLTAEAALLHERSSREALEQERDFLLARVREYQEMLLASENDLEMTDELRGRLAELEVELYESRVYRPKTAAGLSIDEAVQALRLAMENTDSSELEVFDHEAGLGLRLSGRILFLSGQVELDPSGVEVLNGISADLLPLVEVGALIQIVGHTDQEPVTAQAHRFPLGNLQISCVRALAVAEALADAGVSREALTISGMGPLQPIADNETEEGRARNRRVEILVQLPVVTAAGEQAAVSEAGAVVLESPIE